MILNEKLLLVLVGHFFNGFFAQITVRTSFSCENRASGYYADLNTGCQVYHMCDDLGRQFSYSCPNATLFQQRMLICDHWYMVNCNKSEDSYGANLLIGQRDKPFLDESEKRLYIRTPRPDYLTNTPVPKYNVIYRNGQTQSNAFSLSNLARSRNKEVHFNSRSSAAHITNTQLAYASFSSNGENEVENYEENKREDKQHKLQYNFSRVTENSINSDFLTTFKSNNVNKEEETAPKQFLNNQLSNTFKKLPQRLSQIPFPNKRINIDSLGENSKAKGNLASITLEKLKNDENTLKELQHFYFIPDYQFPLETGSRTSYDSSRSSFQNTPNLYVAN